MAFSVVDNGTTLTVKGWNSSVSIAKLTPNATDTFLTATGCFTIAAQDFMARTGYPTAVSSFTTANGSDYAGPYSDINLSLTYSSGSAVVRLRFYHTLNGFEVFETTAATGSQLRTRLTFASSATQWFTLARGNMYGNLDPQSGNYPNVAWSSSFPSGDQDPHGVAGDTVAEFCGGHWGYPYVSGQTGGIAEYVDPTSSAGVPADSTHLLHPTYRYVINANYAEGKVTKPQSGFFITCNAGYRGQSDVTYWHHRKTAPRSYPSNAYLPYCLVAGNYGGGHDYDYNQATIQANMAYCDSHSIPYGMVDFDLRWQTFAGQAAFRNDTNSTGLAAQVAALNVAGKIAVAYLTMTIESGAAGYSNTAALKGGASRTPYWNMIGAAINGWGVYYYDPFTAAGKTAIEAYAKAIVDLGFHGSRFDMVYGNVTDSYAWLKIYSDYVHSYDPGHVIESHALYCSPHIDRIRSNDITPSRTNPEATQAFRLKNTLVHAHGRFIDSDIVGMNDGNGTSYNRSSAQAQMARMFRQQLGYGGYGSPEYAWPQGWMTTLLGSISSSITQTAALPMSIPKRAIVGDWDASYDTLQTYSNGTTLAYSQSLDTLTVGIVPLVAIAYGDHVGLSWTDDVSGENNWYIERRNV